MYNRYIPQPDGSYRRNRVPEPQNCAPPPGNNSRPPTQPEKPAPALQQSCAPPRCDNTSEKRKKPNNCTPSPSRIQDRSAGSFLKQLFPKDIDTSDLLIILLLLLMAGDCEEERSNALLTLALYFFL